MAKRARSQLERRPDARAEAAQPATRLPARVHAPGLLRPLLLVAAVAVIVFCNGIPGDFVFDDKLIQRDPRIRGDTSFSTIFVTDYWYKYIGTSADLYRPLTIASYALNYKLAGLSSAAFHVGNIALHALFCVLLVCFVDVLLRDRTLAIVSGLLFATHPVHTEAVTGIVGRAEVLSGVFLLLALYLHARRYSVFGYGPRLGLPVALVAYFFALLSKETAIVGPGLLLLMEYTEHMAERRGGDEGRWRRAFGVTGLYAGVAMVYLLIRFSVLGQFIQKPPPRSYLLLFGQPLMTRVWTAFEIFAIYVRLLLYPVTLSADYSYRQVPLLDAADAVALMGVALTVVVLGAWGWALRRRARVMVFAVGFFAIAYSLVSNLLIPLQVLVAERLMYLPSVGFCVAVAFLWVLLQRQTQRSGVPGWMRQATVALLVAILLLYGARTIVRNFDWRDNRTLYAATVAAAPECFAAHFNYSAILINMPGQTEAALQQLLRAFEIRQDHYPSLVNLSSLYLRLGQPQKAREIALLGLKVRPEGREIQQVLATAEARLQQPAADAK